MNSSTFPIVGDGILQQMPHVSSEKRRIVLVACLVILVLVVTVIAVLYTLGLAAENTTSNESGNPQGAAAYTSNTNSFVGTLEQGVNAL